MRKLTLVLLALLVAVVVTVITGVLLVGADYRPPDGATGRIYPGVTVAGVNVGDLTRREATEKVVASLPAPEQTGLVIEAGDQTWTMTWALVGQGHDVEAAIGTAYAAGAERAWWLGALYVIHPQDLDIDVPLIPADPLLVRAYVEEIAAQVERAPQDAALTIANGEIAGTPSREGRYLDIDAATALVLAALADDASSVELPTTPIVAHVASPEPALSQALALAQQSVTVVVHDPLVLPGQPGVPGGDAASGDAASEDAAAAPPPAYHVEFVANGQQIANWLRVMKRDDSFQINFDVLGIRAWVETIAAEVDPQRAIDVDHTTAQIAQALRAGDNLRIAALIHHPATTYTVDFGDTFFDIAFIHGFPQWHLEKANPDVEPGLIDVGQELVIPSIDTLLPYPLVDGKRIDIDLPTQTLRAYEEDAMLYELKISSGISSTPTLQGQFQILFKEEMAFAPRWHLDMPYFMGFYEEGEGFFNGIHELPITSYGTRLSSGVLGYPASYGCIIVGEGVAKELFDWAEIGTLVRVNGVAPGTPFGRQTLQDIAPLIESPAP